MRLPPGTRLGSYEVIGPLGAGGMGEVYRARDGKLNRDVALKILPESVASSPERRARFEREAQAIASLSHPNILAVFEFGTHDHQPFVAMELLEGESLRDRLDAGALPARKAIDIAAQIARGLAAAHAKNLIHRDLKPGNVFLLGDGQVKILDFGLAKTFAGDASDSQGEASTRAALTGEGTILGTVGYMAPEQITGGVLDARTDLFALGAVLHEMLAGTSAFGRANSAETMTAVLRDDPPDLAPTRPDLPPGLVRIVQHALEKNPAERFQTARDIAFALEALSGSTPSGAGRAQTGADAGPSGPAARPFGRERLIWLAAVLAFAATAGWLALRKPDTAAGQGAVQRAAILLPAGTAFQATTPPARRMAVSPDGRRVAYAVAPPGSGDTTLYVHSLDAGTSVAIPDSAGAYAPFWSADSGTLAFVQDQRLMIVDPAGGRATLRAALSGSAAGVWNAAGDILLTDGSRSLSLLRASATETQRLNLEPELGRQMGYPTWLSTGGRFLFSTGSTLGRTATLYRADTAGATPERIVTLDLDREAANVVYVAGILVGVRDQMVVARRVDANGAPTGGDFVTLGGPVETAQRFSAAFSVSPSVLVYQPLGTVEATRLTWYDRTGARLSQVPDNARYGNLELSPDGAQLLVAVLDGSTRTRDIWVIDLRRGVRSRVTTDPAADERSAVWTADGSGVVYRGGRGDLFLKPLGAGVDQPFLVDGANKDPLPFSTDGRFVLYRKSGDGTGNDIWIKPVNPAGEPRPFLATRAGESSAAISPDGRWAAYVSDEAGQPDVYVTAFPSGAGKWIVSAGGGDVPRWRGDSRELYYLAPDRVMMAVAIRASATTLELEAPVKLFQTEANRSPGPQFIVTPDGKKFLVNSDVPSGDPPSMTIVFNWQPLLNRR